jgi:uridine kinase
MKGDKIIIQPHHERAAQQIGELTLPEIRAQSDRFIITIAGESGAGKSEIAEALRQVLAEHGVEAAILQQDDYFVYPPKTNAAARRKDISWVGTQEVRLDLMDENLKQIRAGAATITKPLVDFDADAIGEETLALDNVDAVLVEGTYTTLLERAHRRAFIDRSYFDTKKARALRAREVQDDFLDQILQIEHRIISSHRPRADYIIAQDYTVTTHDPTDE